MGEYTLIGSIVEPNVITPEQAADYVKSIIKKIEIDNESLNFHEHFLEPASNQEWELFHRYELYCPFLKKLFDKYDNYLEVNFAFDSQSNYNLFFLRILVPDDNYSLINESAKFIIRVVEKWILNSNVRYSYFHGSKDFLNNDEALSEKSFPQAIGWWNWFNKELLQNIDIEKFLAIPIYKNEEFKDGYVWQLTENFTEKPKPIILQEIKKIFYLCLYFFGNFGKDTFY
ncbi:MAG TPA: hypothetical protein VHY08_26855, partial [Bacillota bacterium]|nr:hypothetical protein [Bacillota bacterium]